MLPGDSGWDKPPDFTIWSLLKISLSAILMASSGFSVLIASKALGFASMLQNRAKSYPLVNDLAPMPERAALYKCSIICGGQGLCAELNLERRS